MPLQIIRCRNIVERADAEKPNLGLTSWKRSVVRKADIVIAKNYLQTEEGGTSQRRLNNDKMAESFELRSISPIISAQL